MAVCSASFLVRKITIGIFINVDEKKCNASPSDATEMQINKWPWTKVIRSLPFSQKAACPNPILEQHTHTPNADKHHLTFGF